MGWRLGYHSAFTTRGTVPGAFGHFGFGGSGGWADPRRDLALAMVCNRGTGTPIGDLRMAQLGTVSTVRRAGADPAPPNGQARRSCPGSAGRS
jgi:CubicO group peptidase (beta-lactamase class C family)